MKILVIGGGPGGYVAAIRAAQLGAEVTLVEKEHLGGTCLNVGCIPTKTLLESAHAYETAGASAEIGVTAEPKLDWPKVQTRRQEVTRKLVGGVEGLLKGNKVKVISGTASFTGKKQVKVTAADGSVQELSFDKCILATGSVPVIPGIPGIRSEFCIDSTQALALDHLPKSMVIVGGGVIGVEMAAAYHAFGTEVTIVEMLPALLPGVDGELAGKLKKDLVKGGVKVLNDTKVLSFEASPEGPQCTVQTPEGTAALHAETMLVCIGRKPYLEGLSLEKAGIACDRFVKVDDHLQTSNPDVYAIGDCNGLIMLAHAASEQGSIAAENCLGGGKVFDKSVCPSGIYSIPEISSVGETEEQLKEKGIAYKKGCFPTAANGRSLIQRCETGVVKVLAGEKYGEILGVHIYAPHATELIGEAVMAMKLEATLDELIGTIHAHPTVCECIHEAALAAENRAIHIANRRK